MTTQKDFKRLVRARMVKTGESYTAARSHFLNNNGAERRSAGQAVTASRTVAPSRPPAGPTVDYEKLAGVSNATIKAKTGCDWKKWTDALDYVQAHEWTHTEIARYVREKFKIDGWWSQSVTVGYERIKGLRAIGQRRSGEFEASKSKTFHVPMSRLYAAFSEKRNRTKWLGEVDLKVGATIKHRSFRMTWTDGKPVAAWFENKGPKKTVVGVTHHKLTDKATAERVKGEWAERLEKLAEVLS
jgi:hypothetical protein